MDKTLPYLVTEATRRVDGDWAWVWFRTSTEADRAAVDRWIVETGHPLGFQAGTRESRFRALVTEELQKIAATTCDHGPMDFCPRERAQAALDVEASL